MLKTFSISSESELSEVAAHVAAMEIFGRTIALTGELGAGKTTFVRYLAAALGAADPVSSPTYVLQHLYAAGDRTIEHWDLYRLGGAPDELLEPCADTVVRLVEWPERAPEVAFDFRVSFALHGDSGRRIEVA